MRSHRRRIAALSTLFVFGATTAVAATSAPPGPSYGGRGYVRNERSITRANVAQMRSHWSATPAAKSPGAALLADGGVYVAGIAGGPGVAALDPATGKELWAWKGAAADTGAPIRSGTDRLIAAEEGVVTALSRATGTPAWTQQVDGKDTAVMAAFNRVFVASDTTTATLDAANGKVRWTAPSGGPQTLNVAYGRIFTTESGLLLVRRPSDGAALWKQPLPEGKGLPSRAFVSKYTTFVTTPNGGGELDVIALDARTGKALWKSPVGKDDCSGCTPAWPVTDDHHVYAATPAGTLTAFERTDGKEHWTVDLGTEIVGDPAVTQGGVVVVALRDKTLVGLSNQTGAALWKQPLGAAPVAGPALGAGAIIVRTDDGRTTAFALNVASVSSAVTLDEAQSVAKDLGVDFAQEKFTVDRFQAGMGVEVAQRNWDARLARVEVHRQAGKIAVEHLRGAPDYYDYLITAELTDNDAEAAARALGVDLGKRGLTRGQLRLGMSVEISRGTWDRTMTTTDEIRLKAAEIALGHLGEDPDFYAYLTGVAVTTDQAKTFAARTGIDFKKVKFTLEQLRIGMDTELRGKVAEVGTKLTASDIAVAEKLAVEHLTANAKYYDAQATKDVTVVVADGAR